MKFLGVITIDKVMFMQTSRLEVKGLGRRSQNKFWPNFGIFYCNSSLN